MKRFFGGKKEPPPPPPSLDDATETVNKRVGVLDDKIRALDKQLIDFKNQLKATRPGPAQARIKQRALQVLKQKRLYEQQRESLCGVAWNMEQASFATANIQTAIHTTAAMKGGTAALKSQMKLISLDEVEDGLDDMAELLEDANEIQEAMGRSYGIDEDIDISELDAELDAIDELSLEADFGETEVPPYLQDEVVEPSPAVPAEPAAATGEQVDEFGLPVATPAGA